MHDRFLQVAAYLARSRVNGPGLRSVVWLQGCHLRCPGCFNPEFWPFEGGQSYSVTALADLLIQDPEIEGVSFSGGEPLAQGDALLNLLKLLRIANKGILVFTGIAGTTLRSSSDPVILELMKHVDLMVAGPYDRLHPSNQPLLASSNQELMYLSNRYKNRQLGPQRAEYRIDSTGLVTITGFPKT